MGKNLEFDIQRLRDYAEANPKEDLCGYWHEKGKITGRQQIAIRVEVTNQQEEKYQNGLDKKDFVKPQCQFTRRKVSRLCAHDDSFRIALKRVITSLSDIDSETKKAWGEKITMMGAYIFSLDQDMSEELPTEEKEAIYDSQQDMAYQLHSLTKKVLGKIDQVEVQT